MACCMKYLSCLLLSLAAGCATYAAGAVVWCVIDPQGAGSRLLFTIPVALVGMTVPGTIGMLCVAFRCEFIRDPKPTQAVASAPVRAPRQLRPVSARDRRIDDEDLEVAFAA